MLLEEIWSKFCQTEVIESVPDNFRSLIDHLLSFLNSDEKAATFLKRYDLNQSQQLYFDVKLMSECFPFSDLEAALVDNPDDFAICLGVALSIVANTLNPYQEEKIILRTAFYNLSRCIAFHDIKAATVGRLVSLEGTIVKVLPSKALVERGGFICYKCRQYTFTYFEDGVFMPPIVCASDKCGNRTLEFDRKTATLSSYQRVKISEQQVGIDGGEASLMPRMLELELRGQLVDCAVPGDVLRVTGTVRTTQQEVNRAQRWSGKGGRGSGSGMESGLHSLFILVQAAVCIKSSRTGRSFSVSALSSSSASLYPYPPSLLTNKTKNNDYHSPSFDSSSSCHNQHGNTANSSNGREYSRHELHIIRSIATGTFHSPSGNPYTPPLSLLVASFCPAILGHELVKLGMLLGLVGSGDNSSSTTGTNPDGQGDVREAIHLLMVGEPGLGKSRLLKAASELSPRAVYVGGATSSTAGLTATVSRESNSGSGGRGDELCVEAGALVLADGGLCCVDELDKATADPHALLEAMEQQQVSLAKGGVVLSLRCRCAVFAACNPAQGRYNPRRSVVDNLGKQLTGPLLSRFDLVFLLLDQPDVDRDRRVSEHVAFGYRQHHQDSSNSNSRKRTREEEEEDDSEEGEDGQELRSLSERLRRAVRRVHKQHNHRQQQQHVQQQQQPSYLLSPEQLKSYLSYARQYCLPITLTADAARCLQRHYLRLRALSVEQGHLQQNTQPVTTRHLESLIRLCRARARLELRQEVTEKDAEDVVALYAEACGVASADGAASSSFAGVGLDSSGKKQRKTNGLGGQANRLLEALQHEAKHRAGQAMFKSQEIDEVVMMLGLDKGAANLIEVLRERGELLLTGPRLFKLNV